MGFGHEQLHVYQLSIDYVGWVFIQSGELTGNHRHARDQWLRASQSIPLNIAEGNGKASEADRRKFFEIARGSALECAAIQDVLGKTNKLESKEHRERKNDLDRICAVLTKLGGRGYQVCEDSIAFTTTRIDSDPDSDSDSEEIPTIRGR
jgi:four helix bundle protein